MFISTVKYTVDSVICGLRRQYLSNCLWNWCFSNSLNFTLLILCDSPCKDDIVQCTTVPFKH